MKVNIKNLMDNVQCYDTVRELRWPKGRQCPFCDSKYVIRRGYDEKELAKQRYGHKAVNHGNFEYARDDDGDGFFEVQVNTMEGFWSLLRSWLRPHRGISQEKLPFYLGFFEFVHNVGKRGRALLHSLIEVLVKCFFFKKQKAGYSSYQQKLG